jgi:hypothetical protein
VAGIPAITHEPRAGGQNTVNEWMEIDDLMRVAHLYASTAISYCEIEKKALSTRPPMSSAGKSEFGKRLQRTWPLQPDKLIILSGEVDRVIRQLRCGILFVDAPWSCSSRLAWQALTGVLSALDLQDLVVYVVNLDDIKDVEGIFLGHLADRAPGGNGETYWIAEGKMIHRWQYTNLYKRAEVDEYLSRIKEYTQHLQQIDCNP